MVVLLAGSGPAPTVHRRRGSQHHGCSGRRKVDRASADGPPSARISTTVWSRCPRGLGCPAPTVHRRRGSQRVFFRYPRFGLACQRRRSTVGEDLNVHPPTITVEALASADGPPSARISTFIRLRSPSRHLPAPTVHRRRGSQLACVSNTVGDSRHPAPTVHRRRGSQPGTISPVRGSTTTSSADGPPSARISTTALASSSRACSPAPTVHRRRGSQLHRDRVEAWTDATPAPTVHRRRGSQPLRWLADHTGAGRQRRRSTVGEDLNGTVRAGLWPRAASADGPPSARISTG